MTDASYDELLVFARHRRWKSGPPRSRGVQRVLDLAPGCTSAEDLLALLEQDDPGDVRAAAIEFASENTFPTKAAAVTQIYQEVAAR